MGVRMTTVAVTEQQREVFERLFSKPDIDTMLELVPRDFELFVAYVFESAGYVVEHIAQTQYPLGPGVDLNLYTRAIGSRPVARVEVRRYSPGNPLDFNDVAAFLGKLGLPRAKGVPGLMVTTSGFTRHARQAADEAERKVQLIDGERLLRYISYVGGSRIVSGAQSRLTSTVSPITPSWLRTGDVVARRTKRHPGRPKVLAIANTKGGVAKTTTALNLAFAFAERYKQKTLLIDLDGQGSVTMSLPRPLPAGISPAQAKVIAAPPDTQFISDYFLGHMKLAQLIRPTRFQRLSLIPAQSELYRLEFSGSDLPKAELRFMEDVRTLLRSADEESGDQFEWIVFDTPAGDTFYGRAALAAADYIVMPAYPEAFGIKGIEDTVTITRTVSALTSPVTRPVPKLLGCVATRWKSSANGEAALLDITASVQRFGSKLYGEPIPADERVETAHRGTIRGQERNIFGLAKSLGPAAKAYDKLAKEIIDDVNGREAKA